MERKEGKKTEKKGKEDEEKWRRIGCSPSIFRLLVNQGVGIVHVPRGRGFSYSIYLMLKGHSMAIVFGPNRRTGL